MSMLKVEKTIGYSCFNKVFIDRYSINKVISLSSANELVKEIRNDKGYTRFTVRVENNVDDGQLFPNSKKGILIVIEPNYLHKSLTLDTKEYFSEVGDFLYIFDCQD